MELILAMDLRQNLVVHGKSGQRDTYKPLDWGCSPTADPLCFVSAIRPRFLYIADLDRIEGTGSHDAIIRQCAQQVGCCYVDRGCHSPSDKLENGNIVNIIGTESGGSDLSIYDEGLLSIDIKDGRVIPCNRDPAEVLESARQWGFDGCILLNVSAVGTLDGIDQPLLKKMRKKYDLPLYYGGGVATSDDLESISSAGFDGAIISTALHKGKIPIEWIRRGEYC
jgi:phosphoribosylformimino-5-aminoimidazole carboxamide ribotide isomerase